MSHHKSFITKRILCVILFAFLSIEKSLAIDNSQTDRSRVVAPRNDRFLSGLAVRKYLNFGGEYESDENSKQHILSFGHFYRSRKLINEVDFLYQKDYSQKASNDYRLTATSELYDFQMSTKAVLFDTQDYLVFYNRSKYNALSTYYYDITSAIGIGHMFFNDALEIDVAIGQNKVKDGDQKITLIPAFRTEFDITEKLHFIQRGFMFFSEDAADYQLRSRFQYSIGPRLYLQVSIDNDKRRYLDKTSYEKINEVHRRIVFGFRYDLGGS